MLAIENAHYHAKCCLSACGDLNITRGMHASTWQKMDVMVSPLDPDALCSHISTSLAYPIRKKIPIPRCVTWLLPSAPPTRPVPPLLPQHPPAPLRAPAPLQRRDRLQHLLELLVPAGLRAHVVVEVVDQHLAGDDAAVRHHEVADHLEHAAAAERRGGGCRWRRRA